MALLSARYSRCTNTAALCEVAWLEPARAHAKRIERLAHVERKRVSVWLTKQTSDETCANADQFDGLTGSGTCKSSKR